MAGDTGGSQARRFDLADLRQTEDLAATLARRVVPSDVLVLSGDLGAGKTAFARAFVRALGAASGIPVDEVPSPTFTLVQAYDFPDFTVHHFDLYRLAAAEESVELGLEDAFADGVSLIEWGERFPALLPEDRLEIRLDFGAADGARTAALVAHGSWRDRLADLAGADRG